MNRTILVLGLLMLLPSAAAVVSPAPAAAVWAALPDGASLVAWTPGTAPAESYRVYGVDAGGAFVLLAQVPGGSQSHVVPAGGYASYAVSGTAGGVETSPTLATGAPSCTYISVLPPGVAVYPKCLREIIHLPPV